ncbi:MAG TPA: tetratricopeptide repeat protein [Thermoleophilaceae bacterium]|nr:tetratricopeptide repeat protein [Thermoleophilaceae bacterium]
MTLTRRLPIKLLVAALAFAATLAVLAVAGSRQSSAPSLAPPPAFVPATSQSTDARIASLQAQVRARPNDPRGYASLAQAYLQKVRETGDASFYTRAGAVLKTALRLDPRSPDAVVVAGTLALARHDFAGALRLGKRARALTPDLAAPYGVLVDALIELGRYDQAGHALQRWVDIKPTLASYARVSYWRELHGDLGGAIDAMRDAISAGGDVAENGAYVQTLLGNLDLQRGRFAAAERAYRAALARFAGYVPAQAGLARVAGARGHLDRSISGFRRVVARLPLPEYVVALGETEVAAGRGAAARRDLALVGVEERLLRVAGVDTDVDLAVFEASHGSPARGVQLARRAWAAAPSVRSADALGWALTRAGQPAHGLRFARQALHLGSRDPMFLFHAAVAAHRSGHDRWARTWLSRALAGNPRFSPLYAPEARRMLEALR